MNKTDIKRQLIVEQLAAHLLSHGMRGASLRQLANAAGTSDRMLLHYFVDKEALLTAALSLLTQRLTAMLDASRIEPLPLPALINHLVVMMKDSAIRPFMKLWLQLAAVATDEPYYRLVARQISNSFFDWICLSIYVDDESDRKPKAALVFATVEGFVLLEALDHQGLIETALTALGKE
jgi:AcrR family transcriptional regulator